MPKQENRFYKILSSVGKLLRGGELAELPLAVGQPPAGLPDGSGTVDASEQAGSGRFQKIIASLAMATPRKLTGRTNTIFRLISFSLAVLFLYTAGPPFLGIVEIEWKRGLFLALISIMILMKYPGGSKAPQHTISRVDGIIIACAIVSFGYWILAFRSLIDRVGFPTTADIVLATVAIIICLEITRRVLGIIIPIIVLALVGYATLGDTTLLPSALRSPGFAWSYFAAYSYGLEGMFGFILAVIVDYIVLFVVFGGLLKALGAEVFFIDLPYALTAGLVGGPAKTAVVASCLFGSISGSATANTAATGAFTIPLMKKAGYPKEIAGAIEPAASTGGMFMPPVMGAGAFIMAEMLHVSYGYIVTIGFVPALIYFFSVFMFCHFYAIANPNIRVVPKEERPGVWETFRKGFYYLIPILLLVYLLVTFVTPMRAVYWSIVSILVIAFIVEIVRKGERPISRVVGEFGGKLYQGFEEGGEGAILVGAIGGSIGLVVASALVTGLAFTFTSSVMSLSGGSILIAIALSFAVAFVLGMGLTVTAAYILCAIMCVPVLVKLGVNPIAAHFLVFWFSQTSNLSPPVCVAAFVGAAIAGAHPYKVGFNSMLFGAALFVMPLMFVYSDILMPHGFTASAALAMFNGFAACIPYAAGITGYYRRKVGILSRALLLLSAGLLLYPNVESSVIALVIMFAIYLLNGPKAANWLPARLRGQRQDGREGP
jgi:TRAP transporter 4TM/12TM fusion protein